MNNYEEEYFEDEENLEDEDDFWSETPEFDEKVEEFKEALRADIKRETQELIEKLQKELDELKDYKENKLEIERNYHDEIAKMAKAEADIERKYRDMRLYELFDEFCVAGWKVATRYEQPEEKCDKCDENGDITFYSPQGIRYTEQCKCRKEIAVHFPEETKLVIIQADNKSWREDEFYYRKVKGESESFCEYVDCKLVKNSDFTPEDINRYHTVFANKEDCEKYCEWLNNKEKNNE
nr:MAG TPA: hypothetical protein [Caudoviricetes sp.]